jgi:hypothetical protein
MCIHEIETKNCVFPVADWLFDNRVQNIPDVLSMTVQVMWKVKKQKEISQKYLLTAQ